MQPATPRNLPKRCRGRTPLSGARLFLRDLFDHIDASGRAGAGRRARGCAAPAGGAGTRIRRVTSREVRASESRLSLAVRIFEAPRVHSACRRGRPVVGSTAVDAILRPGRRTAAGSRGAPPPKEERRAQVVGRARRRAGTSSRKEFGAAAHPTAEGAARLSGFRPILRASPSAPERASRTRPREGSAGQGGGATGAAVTRSEERK